MGITLFYGLQTQVIGVPLDAGILIGILIICAIRIFQRILAIVFVAFRNTERDLRACAALQEWEQRKACGNKRKSVNLARNNATERCKYRASNAIVTALLISEN
eukprot:1141847-Pelagomonas_calceolata.AAC.6